QPQAFLRELPQLVRKRNARIAVRDLEHRADEAGLRQQPGRLIARAEIVEHTRCVARLLKRCGVELAPGPPEQIRVAREIAGARIAKPVSKVFAPKSCFTAHSCIGTVLSSSDQPPLPHGWPPNQRPVNTRANSVI